MEHEQGSPQTGQEGDLPLQEPRTLGPSPEVREVLYRAVALGIVIVLGCLILIVAAFSIGSGLIAGPAETMPPVPSPTVTVTVQPLTTAPSPTTPAPVDTLPAKLSVGVSVDKNLAGNVNVNYLGGEGRSLVKQIQTRLTHPDGTVVTGTIDPQSDTSQLTLAGSKGTDRIEVYALMYSGKLYKITDQQVPYPLHP